MQVGDRVANRFRSLATGTVVKIERDVFYVAFDDAAIGNVYTGGIHTFYGRAYPFSDYSMFEIFKSDMPDTRDYLQALDSLLVS